MFWKHLNTYQQQGLILVLILVFVPINLIFIGLGFIGGCFVQKFFDDRSDKT